MVVLVLVLGVRNRGRFVEFLGTGETAAPGPELLACSPPGCTTTYIRLSSLIGGVGLSLERLRYLWARAPRIIRNVQ